jgi:hypothetical protein
LPAANYLILAGSLVSLTPVQPGRKNWRVNPNSTLLVVLVVIVLFLVIRNALRIKANLKASNERYAEEARAKRARQGPNFKRGAGQAEPSVALYGPPDSEGFEDITPASPEKAIEAAVARRDQRRLDELRLGGSRFGGVPDLPADLPWPTVEGKKLPFLAQIDLSEMPKGPLPSEGWLFAFGLYDDDHPKRPVAVVHHRGPREALVRAQPPKKEEVWPAWSRKTLYAIWPVVTSPAKDSGDDAAQEDYEGGHLFGELEDCDSAASIADEQDQSGDDWITLLVIRSVGSMMWSDCGVFHIAIRRQDLLRHDFSNVCAEVCCVG